MNTQNILIIGGSGDIGSSVLSEMIARRDLNTVYNFILLGRNLDKLNRIKNKLMHHKNVNLLIYGFNLCNATYEDYINLQQQLKEEFTKLDHLIFAAGMLGYLTPIANYELGKWFQVIQTNFQSKFLLSQTLIPVLNLSSKPQITFLLNSNANTAYWGAYACAEAATEKLATLLAEEHQNQTNHLIVNKVFLAPTNTEFRKKAFPAELNHNLATPEHTAKLVCDAINLYASELTTA